MSISIRFATVAALVVCASCGSPSAGYATVGAHTGATTVSTETVAPEVVVRDRPVDGLTPVTANGGAHAVGAPAHSDSNGHELAAFATPEAAMLAVAAAGESGDHERIRAIFGHDCQDVVGSEGPSGDDEDDCAHVARMIRERLTIVDGADGRKVAMIGKDEWRFPVPLARTERGYAFDLDGGRDELDTREIGRNELVTVAALEELAQDQRESGAESRDVTPRGFARSCKSQPVDGYLYKALGGSPASRGAESRPSSSGALAWPAEYGVTGVMTFMVDQSGIVFEKDLGPSTAEEARALTVLSRDATWAPTKR